LTSHLVSASHPETLHSRYIHWNFTIQHPTLNIVNHFHILNFVFQLFTWKVYLSTLSNFAFLIPTLRHSSIFTTKNFIFQLHTSKLCISVAYPKNWYSSSIPWDFTTLPHIKGSLTRDFCLRAFSRISFSPGPRVPSLGHLTILRKFADLWKILKSKISRQTPFKTLHLET
jgi:hypothetical protein